MTMVEGEVHPRGDQLTRRDVRTLALASLGGALEFYDFVVFVFFTAVIAKLFFPPDMPEWLAMTQTYGLFAAGYVARPLGGIIMAHFGDLVGRKRMFLFSVFLMAVPTLCIGLMPTYETLGYAAPLLLLFFRILQGASLGGEAPGAWVFLAEHVPPGRVGLACGMLTGGLTFGIVLGSGMALIVNAIWTPAEVADWAWRIPFLTGGAFGFLAMYLRRFLDETPVFEAMRRRSETATGLPLWEVLRMHSRAVILSFLGCWMLTAAIVVLILLTPGFLQTLHGFTALETSLANLGATITLTVSAVLTGAALDRWGVRPVMVISALGFLAGAYGLYAGVESAPGMLIPLYALCGITVGAVTIVPFMMVNAFPARVRFSGVSFCYNTAYAVFGGTTPLFISLLLQYDRLAPAHYVALATLVGTIAVLTWAGGVYASAGRRLAA